MFDLAQNRVIPLTVAGHTYTLTLQPATKAQWLKYFAGIQSLSETVEGKRIDSFDSTAARVQLVTETLVDAHGYRTAGGALKDQANWQELIPVAHRLAAGNILVSVARSEANDEEAILLGAEMVRLDALGNDSKLPGDVAKIYGLRHFFKTPTVAQQRRYNSDMSRSQIVGGSRTGKTRWLGAQATLVELYDELVIGAEGYLHDGEWYATDRTFLIRIMDTFHKVAAAEALFSPVAPEIVEPDVKEAA